MSNCIGVDVGTYNLVVSRRNKDGEVAHKREINAFIEMPMDNQYRFVFNMMKNAGVPLIERDQSAYALGEKALQIAFSLNSIELRRCMSGGTLNPRESSAFEILRVMLFGLVGDIDADRTPCYFTVPANAINQETDADYHTKVLKAIFDSYKSEKGYRLDAHPINEALCLIYAELASKAYTGISASCGSGMINVTYAIFGAPVFQFSLVNSGDWIDQQAAKACGESPTVINKEKMKIDLSTEPTSLVERAIKTQYHIMIEKTVQGILKGLNEAGKKARSDQPVDFIVAGGTSLPNGFDTLFADVLSQANLPIKIASVVRPPDALYSVARGALIAAENSASN